MDCAEFDEQVVRLEGIEEIAKDFVRVRVAEIQRMDLDRFDFDYDLTFMVFFAGADGPVLGRYGGRDHESAESRMSLAGLNHAMKAALAAHRDRDPGTSPPPRDLEPRTIADYPRARPFLSSCIHCHQAKEILISDRRRKGEWTRDDFWRFPLPGNVGITLAVDRGDVVSKVAPGSPAAVAGVQAGDVLGTIGKHTVSSFGDALFALDRGPVEGTLDVTWSRNGTGMNGTLKLARGWRETNLSWRTSLQRYLPEAGVKGTDLSPAEREALGLSRTQLAFRQGSPVSSKAEEAGIREGDVILGFNGKTLEMTASEFQSYVRGNFLKGDEVTVNLRRNGEPMMLRMTL